MVSEAARSAGPPRSALPKREDARSSAQPAPAPEAPASQEDQKTVADADFVSVIARSTRQALSEPAEAAAPRSARPARPAPERQLVAEQPPEDQRPEAGAGASLNYIRNPAQFGSLAYLLQDIECQGEGEALLHFYQGMVTDLKGEAAQFQVGRLINVWYDPKSTGVNDNDWFCSPQRRFCYGDVSHQQWKGDHQPGDRMDVDFYALENAQDNLLNYAESLAQYECGG